MWDRDKNKENYKRIKELFGENYIYLYLYVYCLLFVRIFLKEIECKKVDYRIMFLVL